MLRTVQPEFARATESFLNSTLARRLMSSGAIVDTHIVGSGADGRLELEHDYIDFPSYPWEWSSEQWIDAAVLTLDLCNWLLDSGLILKDTTPLNILFRDAQPVLVDVLSVEQRDPENPLWIAYGQFVRTFLLPLLAHKYLGWPLAASQIHRDGYEPGELYPHLPFLRRWLGPARGLITLPVLADKLGKSGKGQPPKLRFSADASLAILRARLRSLKKTVLSLRDTSASSHWSGYTTHCAHYSQQDGEQKVDFVKRSLESIRPRTVLDIGANTGAYSRLAVAAGARVVALDVDGASTAIHYRSAHSEHRPVLPLHADIARPTPSTGWRNRESLPLLERCRQHFDCVMMLGLLHHLLVTDQIPLAEIAALTAELAPHNVIVEWIPRTDPKFIEVCRGRDALYEHLSEDSFLAAFGEYFRTEKREALGNGRVLFLLEAR